MDYFFEQPFNTSLKQVIVTNDRVRGYLTYGWDIAWNKKKLSQFCRLYHSLVHYNENTRKYIEEDYKAIISPNERVLGVLCRGTDYIHLHPQWHPIQLSIEDMINKVKLSLIGNKYDKIYLATEDEYIYHKFVVSFPDYMIVTNKRQYFGELYNKMISERQPKRNITNVILSRNDVNYWIGLQYLSSMEILSRCTSLVAGNCGGTCLALLMNNLHYEDVYVFNLGLYS